MGDTHFEAYDSKQKAKWKAQWLDFEHRQQRMMFSVIPFLSNTWRVVRIDDAREVGIELESLPHTLSEFSYEDIRVIKADNDPLWHFEEICGLFAGVDGELLRYILHAEIPLEKLVRYELAQRGYDKDHRWCGFEKAESIWLT